MMVVEAEEATEATAAAEAAAPASATLLAPLMDLQTTVAFSRRAFIQITLISETNTRRKICSQATDNNNSSLNMEVKLSTMAEAAKVAAEAKLNTVEEAVEARLNTVERVMTTLLC